MLHEIGHVYGLEHFGGGCTRPCSAMCNQYANQASPTDCDDNVISGIYCPAGNFCEPAPTGDHPPIAQECPEPTYSCDYEYEMWSSTWCRCVCRSLSPVLIDVYGDGFRLTAAEGGVSFDLNSDGYAEHLSWTEAGSDDAWLALDRDGDGTVENGQELFGNFTPQAPSSEANGFLVLAEFDKPESGGNGDGVIGDGDAAYADLRLWQDANHNGLSEQNELLTLTSLGLAGIELDYKESRRRDRHGNEFLYRAKVYGTDGMHLGRWAYDVFLVTSQ